MKKLAFFLVAILSVASNSIADARPEILSTRYHTGYIPDGFDSNDRVQMVAEGIFPNSCYRPAGVTSSVDEAQKVITLKAQAYHYDGFCLQMIVPYNDVITVGLLKAGNYTVKQEGSEVALGALKVLAATNSTPDDYLYAPVDQAFVTQEMGNKLTISGTFTNSCMKLVDTLVHVQPKVVTVQPISELAAGPDCKDGSFPFTTSTQLPSMNPGRYLLHVRSLNSTAINTLFDVR